MLTNKLMFMCLQNVKIRVGVPQTSPSTVLKCKMVLYGSPDRANIVKRKTDFLDVLLEPCIKNN